jgi:hypothetical protein
MIRALSLAARATIRATKQVDGAMQIAWPSATTRCTQFSLSVRKRGDRADFDKMYARYTPSPHGRALMPGGMGSFPGCPRRG